MRRLGLDIGDKRIGVAISDATGTTARGLAVILRKDLRSDIADIGSLVDAYKVEEIIVGMPFNMDGSLGPQGKKVAAFVDILRKQVLVRVKIWDERLSTLAAQKTLILAEARLRRRRQAIDKVAATLILQGYLDSRRRLKKS